MFSGIAAATETEIVRLSLLKLAQGRLRDTPKVSKMSATVIADGKVTLPDAEEVPTTPDCVCVVALNATSVGQLPPVPAAFLAHSVTLAKTGGTSAAMAAVTVPVYEPASTGTLAVTAPKRVKVVPAAPDTSET